MNGVVGILLALLPALFFLRPAEAQRYRASSAPLCLACKIDPAEQQAGDESLFLQPLQHSVTFENRNDDKLLGLVPSSSKGADFGDTNDFRLTYRRYLLQKFLLSVILSDHLYTREAAKAGYEYAARGTPGPVVVRNKDDDFYMNQFIDDGGLSVGIQGTAPLYAGAEAGLHYREVNLRAGNPPFGVAVQEGWHRLWNRLVGMDMHQHVSANGASGGVQTVDQNGVPTKVVTEGYLPDPKLQALSRLSVELALNVGGRIRLFRGRCELKTEFGGRVATEGNAFIGPNSYARGETELRTKLFRRKYDRGHRVVLSTGAEVRYFPVSWKRMGLEFQNVENPELGTVLNVGIESRHFVGKSGNSLVVFTRFAFLNGGLLFPDMNDVDALQAIGIRFNLHSRDGWNDR